MQKKDVCYEKKGDLYNKKVDLDKSFSFSLVDSLGRTSKDRSGFAFTAHKKEEKTFSWEWFEFDRKGHAKKLQGKGVVSVNLHDGGPPTEIKRVEFLDDISFRIRPEHDWNLFGWKWRIKILKGSVIDWPRFPSQSHK